MVRARAAAHAIAVVAASAVLRHDEDRARRGRFSSPDGLTSRRDPVAHRRAAPPAFEAGWNRDHFSGSVEPQRPQLDPNTAKKPKYSGKSTIRWNKRPLLPRRHSYEPSQLRHCREATKITPRCLV
jgi:hypothetical protein